MDELEEVVLDGALRVHNCAGGLGMFNDHCVLDRPLLIHPQHQNSCQQDQTAQDNQADANRFVRSIQRYFSFDLRQQT